MRTEILGVAFDNVTMQEAVARCLRQENSNTLYYKASGNAGPACIMEEEE